MSSILVCRAKILSVGTHRTKLTSVSTVQSPLNRGRDALEFRFEGPDGEISKVTGSTLRVGESLHELLEQLLGAEIASGDEVDLDRFVGHEYEIVVVSNRTGGIALDRVAPVCN